MELDEKQRTRLAELIASAGLQEHKSALMSAAEACYRVFVTEPDNYARVGNSRFGGDPDLPADFSWPRDPQSEAGAVFLAQLDLAELEAPELPRAGLLSFWTWGTDAAAHPVAVDAYYFEPGVALRRHPNPPPDELADEYLTELSAVRARFERGISIGWNRPELSRLLRATDGLDEALEGVRDALRDDAIGQVLGAAVSWQDRDLYRSVALEQAGRLDMAYSTHFDTMEEYEEALAQYRRRDDHQSAKMMESKRARVRWWTEHREEIDAEAARWQCLLRIDSNPAMGLWINDADPLFVFIRRTDLAERRFGRMTGRVLQS